jgi:hypothetical protein
LKRAPELGLGLRSLFAVFALWPLRAGRVARWFVFKPKTQIWVNSCNGRSWYILWTLGPFLRSFVI